MKTVKHLCLFLLFFIFFDFHECERTGGGKGRNFNHIRLMREHHHGSHDSHPATYHAIHHPKNPPIHQSIGHPMHHSTHPTHYPAHHSTHHQASHSSSPAIHQSINQSRHHSIYHLTQHPIHHTTHQPAHHSTHHQANHPASRTTHQSTGHSTHHSAHQPIHHQANHSTSAATPHQRQPEFPSQHHYTTGDTGSTALGIYVGYKLGQLLRPTDSHRSRYDHYTVHHYYHNRETVPLTEVIQSKDMTECVGDSVEICPGNTTALCTSNGVLMCVANITSTVPCKDKKIQGNCFKSTISCHNNMKDSGCKRYGSTTISIPCIFIAKVRGAFKYINNTITPLHKSTPYKLSQKLCVMVVAVPAEKPPTVEEMIFDGAKQLATALIKKL